MTSDNISLPILAWMPTHREPFEDIFQLFTVDTTESWTLWIDTYFAGIRLGSLLFVLALYVLCAVAIPLVTTRRSPRSYALRVLAFVGVAPIALITTLESLAVGRFWLTVLTFSVGILASASSLIFIFWGTRMDLEAHES